MSYGDDTGFEAWLTGMGYTLPVSAPSPAVLRARGSAYLDGAYEALWTGTRTDTFTQDDAWPRTGATLNCVVAVPSDLIPPAVINASYRAAWLEGSTPGVLSGSPSSGPRVKRQKVDVIEREFFDDGKAAAGAATGFVDPEIDGAMRQFICDAKAGPFLMTLGS